MNPACELAKVRRRVAATYERVMLQVVPGGCVTKPAAHSVPPLLTMTPISAAQVDAYAAEKKLQVVGVYHASERLSDAALSPVAARIAEKLQQRCCPQSAVFIVRLFPVHRH